MTPGAHLLISWLSTAELVEEQRGRRLVALTGIAPDIDGLGIIIDKLTGASNYYFKYHHYLGHSIFAALAFATIASMLAKSQKKLIWCLSFLVVHLHILGDMVGSKGPDGYQWPIYYLFPLNSSLELTWAHQWELNAWPNNVIMAFLLLLSLYYAAKKNISFIEVISPWLDKEAFKMYHKYIHKKAE